MCNVILNLHCLPIDSQMALLHLLLFAHMMPVVYVMREYACVYVCPCMHLCGLYYAARCETTCQPVYVYTVHTSIIGGYSCCPYKAPHSTFSLCRFCCPFTVGFGNVTVNEPEARAFIVFYASVGIPLAIILIANLGKLLSRAFKTALKPFRRNLYVLIAVYIIFLLCGAAVVVLLPAWVFVTVEGPETLPNYGTALYFCFVALSTIGYGRFVVLRNENNPASLPLRILYVAFFTVWMFVGLAYLGLIIQEVVVGVSLLWKKLGKYLPCCGGEVAEMDFEERPLEKLVKKAKHLRQTVKSSLREPSYSKHRRRANHNSRELCDTDLSEPWLINNQELCEDPTPEEPTDSLTSQEPTDSLTSQEPTVSLTSH